jgi:signal transduction histidine kinase/FixJ family two-component response regulator
MSLLERDGTEATLMTGGVLVVDDDEHMRETWVEILQTSGITAEGVSSAAEAEARQPHLAPGVALVDQRLPDGPGVELGSLLKSRDADLTVLLVTGYANLENAIAAVWEVDGYLTKPVPPAELVRVVRSGLETARLRRENRTLVGELQHANRMLEASVADRTSELSGLVTLAEALAGSTELDDVLDACLHAASHVTGARHAALYLPAGDEDPTYRLAARLGARGFPDTLADPSTDGAASVDDILPLTAGGRRVGVLVLGDAARRQAMFLATLAASAAVAVQNAQRFGRERETVERLSELSRMKSTFLGAVSHELRTPLAALLGLAELLGRRLETTTTERRQEMVDQILDQGRRLGVLIDDLLDATRVEFGGLRVALVDVDMHRVVTRVEETFRAAGRAVDVDLVAEVPAAIGDEGRLEQVLTNLVGNAFKHSPDGAPVVVEAGADDEHVRVSVVDSGSGIDAEFLPRLFEPFTQAATLGFRDDGIGLGLYISRGLVDAMGGAIEVESRPGHGSRFTIRLKRSD